MIFLYKIYCRNIYAVSSSHLNLSNAIILNKSQNIDISWTRRERSRMNYVCVWKTCGILAIFFCLWGNENAKSVQETETERIQRKHRKNVDVDEMWVNFYDHASTNISLSDLLPNYAP